MKTEHYNLHEGRIYCSSVMTIIIIIVMLSQTTIQDHTSPPDKYLSFYFFHSTSQQQTTESCQFLVFCFKLRSVVAEFVLKKGRGACGVRTV